MKKTTLADILADSSGAREASAATGVVIGRLAGFGPGGEPIVDYFENPTGQPRPALATVRLGAADIGHEVALTFLDGSVDRPLVLGPLLRPDADNDAATEPVVSPTVAASVDGERVEFNAEQEIVLRCGAASITLTRAGKILIRGKYVLSRSSGVNRIKGGSIQLN